MSKLTFNNYRSVLFKIIILLSFVKLLNYKVHLNDNII